MKKVFFALLLAVFPVVGLCAQNVQVPAEVRLGECLFRESRFGEYFKAQAGGNVNAPPPSDDLATDRPGSILAASGRDVSCATCHLASVPAGGKGSPDLRLRTLDDLAGRSPVPARGDGRQTTPRHAPPLADLLAGGTGPTLLHWDGEFTTAEDLVTGTFTGRNFGWLPAEQAEAKAHFARVIREDYSTRVPHGAEAHLPYAMLLRGVDAGIPPQWRLSAEYRFDPAHSSDEEVLRGCARLVVVYLRSLRFSRDADDRYNGSPYDAFLAANRLPAALRVGESGPEYTRRLRESVAALRAPRFIDEPQRKLRSHDQAFRFGELELRGLKIFLRNAVGTAQKSGAGNCAECHVPPRFTDFSFHNTGVAQDEFDSVHGAGAFAKLSIPDLPARSADYDRWMQPTPRHPLARAVFVSAAAAGEAGRADLGLWNVYANPDLPSPQPGIERLLNRNGKFGQNEMLALALARFKTPTVRDLGQSGPYFHNGEAHALQDAPSFYQRMSSLAQQGKLRNAPPEYFDMRLDQADVEPLTAFLRALNEDYGGAEGG